MKGYCDIYVIAPLSLCIPMVFMSTLSMHIDPSLESTILNIVCKIELFPAPVLPTIPIFYPASNVRSKSLIEYASPS